MGSKSQFLAVVTAIAEEEGVINAVIFDPRAVRGKTISFPHTKLGTEGKEWQKPYVVVSSFLVGELEDDDFVSKVKLLSEQQFRGIVREWDPIYMRAVVYYPEIQQTHEHCLETPWMAEGDRIIVKGSFSGVEWSVGDFRLHRRVRSYALETGTITSLQARRGELKSMSGSDLEFGYRDVLLCDFRDFYPETVDDEDYDPDLENTFRVGRAVFFIRALDARGGAIKVFVPRTEFGILDPIFEPAFHDAARHYMERSRMLSLGYVGEGFNLEWKNNECAFPN